MASPEEMSDDDKREHDDETDEIQSGAQTTFGRFKIGPCGNGSSERIVGDLIFLYWHVLPFPEARIGIVKRRSPQALPT